MGNSWLCVLAGSVTMEWKTAGTGVTVIDGGEAITIAPIDSDCTSSHDEFWVAANARVGGKQRYASSTSQGLQLTTVDGALALWAPSGSISEGEVVQLGLDGVTFASTSGLPSICDEECSTGGPCSTAFLRAFKQVLGEPHPPQLELQQGQGNEAGQIELGEVLGEGIELRRLKAALAAAESRATQAEKRAAKAERLLSRHMHDETVDHLEPGALLGEQQGSGCVVTSGRVNVTGFPTVIGTANMLAMGNTIQNRVCALHGVVEFTSLNGEAVAQLDPNLRDPTGPKLPLCFPLSAMVFFAGLVLSTGSPILRSVAVQIEPHGRVLVLAGLTSSEIAAGVKLRLDGIIFQPFARFNSVPGCAPYCFPASANSTAMDNSGCVKYCAPEQYSRGHGTRLELEECRCDMVKRLECWHHDGESDIRCGQYKQLLNTYLLSGDIPPAELHQRCALTCARQLAAL